MQLPDFGQVIEGSRAGKEAASLLDKSKGAAAIVV